MKIQLIGILDKLLAIGGNHDRVALMEARHELLDFSREEEQLLAPPHDESKMTALNAIRFIDAQAVYATSTNKVKSGKYLHSFFDHLMTSEKWNYYELRFIVGSLHLADSLKQTLSLANESCEKMRDFKAITCTDHLSGWISANIIKRILYAKYFEDNHGIDLEDELTKWFLKLEILASENNKLQVPFDIAEIRQAVFKQERQTIYQLTQDFKIKHNDKIVENVVNEVNFYMASERYNQLYLKIS